MTNAATGYFSFGSDSTFGAGGQATDQDNLNDTLPELPPVPKESNEGPSNTSLDERLDFEDLSRRFEELKSKKN